MDKKAEEMKVALSGMGWFLTGIVSVVIGIILNGISICQCLNAVHEFLYLGVVSFLLGVGIILARGKIAIKVMKIEKSARTKHK